MSGEPRRTSTFGSRRRCGTSNAYIPADELEPYWTARTVRVRNGTPTVSDGPAVQAEEFLTGYFLIEAESLEAALEWAATVPNARNGSVEVRQVDQGDLARRMAAAGVESPSRPEDKS